MSRRRTIPAKALFTTTAGGKWVDRMLSEGRSAIREGAIAWPWHLTADTQFCFAFGSSAEAIDSWAAMLSSARRVGGGGAQVYAHNFAPTDPPSPIRRANVDVALVLNEVAPAQWNTAKLGNHFSKFDLSDAASAALCPCFRVTLSQGALFSSALILLQTAMWSCRCLLRLMPPRLPRRSASSSPNPNLALVPILPHPDTRFARGSASLFSCFRCGRHCGARA